MGARSKGIACALAVLAVIAVGLWLSRPPAHPLDADWYASVERLDPIFAVDGTDPAQLRDAIATLFAQRDAIARGLPASEAGIVHESLYPAAFLALLPDLQAARAQLLAKPTSAHAQSYHDLLLKTIDAYAADARRASSALMTAPQSSAVIAFQSGTTTPQYLAQQLAQVALDAQSQKEKEERRYACYERPGFGCESPERLRGHLRDAGNDAPALATPDQEAVALDGLVRDLTVAAFPGSRFSPLLSLSSSCFPYKAVYARSFEFPLGSRTARKTYIANDAFFYDINQTAAFPDAKLDQLLQRQGGRWEYQNIANAYMCPDAGLFQSDFARILGALELAHATTTLDAQRLAALPNVSLSDAARFVRASGSDEATARFLEGSSRFDEDVRGLVSDSYYLEKLQKAGGTMPLTYLLVARSYDSTLFLLGNPTFAGHSVSLFFPDPKPVLAPGRNFLSSWRHDLAGAIATSTLFSEAKRTMGLYYRDANL